MLQVGGDPAAPASQHAPTSLTLQYHPPQHPQFSASLPSLTMIEPFFVAMVMCRPWFLANEARRSGLSALACR